MARILVVEDDEALRELIETFCDEEGHAVDAVSSLEEAVGRLRDTSFDLVLRDSFSPTPERFYDASDPILAADRHPPVVIVSAHALDPERVMSLGYAELVTKPFDIDVFGDLLKRFLDPISTSPI